MGACFCREGMRGGLVGRLAGSLFLDGEERLLFDQNFST